MSYEDYKKEAADRKAVARFREAYMGQVHEYPEGAKLVRGLRDGVLYSYVSSDYLNGLVNYVRPIKAFVINAYREDGFPPEAFAEALATIEVHANLRVFKDDVLLLARIAGASFAYFHFDQDVSDCEVGAFAINGPLEETEADVVRKFEEHVQALSRLAAEGPVPRCYEIPLEKLSRGWISA